MGDSKKTTTLNCISCALDFVPGIGTAKGLYEGFSGKDAVTGENLNGFERAMGFVGAIPLVGGFIKGGSEGAKIVSKGAKVAKLADDTYDGCHAISCAKDLIDEKEKEREKEREKEKEEKNEEENEKENNK